jgi:hypothetical protein
MNFLDVVARYLKVTVNRVRCKYCNSRYNEGSFFIDPEGIRFRSGLVRPTRGNPMYMRRAKGARTVLVLSKSQDLDMAPVLYMVCPLCNNSRRVELPIRNG